MTSWVKEVASEDLKEGAYYFFAKKWLVMGRANYNFYGKGLNGKCQWTVKPGIAIHARYDEKFRTALAATPNSVAVEIPADWATRWKRRTKR